jgi:hypothetical protein
VGVKDFGGDSAIEHHVMGDVHSTHGAAADDVAQPVTAAQRGRDAGGLVRRHRCGTRKRSTEVIRQLA